MGARLPRRARMASVVEVVHDVTVVGYGTVTRSVDRSGGAAAGYGHGG